MWQPTNKLEQERLEKLHELEAAGILAYPGARDADAHQRSGDCRARSLRSRAPRH